MKKKGIALVLVLALALTLIGVAVATDPESNLTMETSKMEVDDRETFTVTVKNKAATFNALTFYVEFPTEDLTVTGVTWKLNGVDCCSEPVVGDTVVAGGASTAEEANASGKVGFYYLDVESEGNGKAYDADALQAVITFRVKEVHTEGKDRNSTGEAAITLHEDSEGGNGLIALLNKWLSNEDAKVSFTKQALAYVLGDVDLNSTVEAADLTALAAHLAGNTLLTNETSISAADVDKNNTVEAADLTKLAAYLAGNIASLD